MMLKHLHMTLAGLSVILFTLRFVWMLLGSGYLNKKWVKILPHVIDTLLFAFGITLAIQLALNPVEQLWLLEKIIAIFAYVFTGMYTLKFARNRTMQVIGYLGAMGWILLIVQIAMTKETVFF